MLRELCTWNEQLPNSGCSTLGFSFGRVLIHLSLHTRVPGDCEERLENPEEQFDADQLAQATYVTSRQEEGTPIPFSLELAL